MNMTMISIDSVSLQLDPAAQPVLNNIQWTISSQERWILFGRNGCGKTKLLEVITGYRRPTSGSVTRFGYPQSGHDIREIRKRIGYLSSPLLEKIHPRETARDIVTSGFYATAGLYDTPLKEHVAYADYLLHKAALYHRRDDIFSHFSDGEKQKLLLARAMTGKPDLVILDEPCSGLDIVAREELLHTLSSFFDESSAALIYVTHHVEEITPLFSHVFMLSQGNPFFCGLVEEGITTGQMSALFGLGVTIYTSKNRYHTILS
ncbi:MAG: ABC transporter ATP-binding protein [Spirochaetota bacterium]